jgi:predicted nucleic acid-binding protein
LSLHEVDIELAGQAADIAIEARLRGCDAVYVALAAQLGERLVTLDAEQLEPAGAVVTVGRPGEENVQ